MMGRITPTTVRWSKHRLARDTSLAASSVKITHLRCLITVLKIFQLAHHLRACFSKGHGGRRGDNRNRDRRILRGVANRYRFVLIGSCLGEASVSCESSRQGKTGGDRLMKFHERSPAEFKRSACASFADRQQSSHKPRQVRLGQRPSRSGRA